MKDGLNDPAVMRLAANLQRAWEHFDSDGFVAEATEDLDRLELKERVT
ncbi:MAG TPA: DNA alkylation repair protein, partial [Nannocystis exedens]|nr:DNA alkylation repair protein [Nannocystis exedens]